jgi:hypothetical protein
MTERAVVIEGMIALDTPQALDGAVAEVMLRGKAPADGATPIVARANIRCSGSGTGGIPFRLEATIDDQAEYSLAAEIRMQGGDRLAPGDMVTTAYNPWRYGAGEVTLPVKKSS